MALKLERAGWGTGGISGCGYRAAYDLAQARRRAGDLRYGAFEEARKTGIRCAASETEQTRNDDDALVARLGNMP